MTAEELRRAVLEELKRIAPEVEESELVSGKLLRDQVDLDSMDWLNFLVALHERFRVEIPEADYAKLGTLDELLAYLARRLPANVSP
jgi:acyl carrier protein